MQPRKPPKRSVWVKFPEQDAVPVDLDAELLDGCGNDLKMRIREQLGMPYRPGDLFLDLPAGAVVDPKLGTYLTQGTRALDPKKKLDATFFDLLGDRTIEVRVRTGALPLPTQPGARRLPEGPDLLARLRSAAADPDICAAWSIVPKDDAHLAMSPPLDPASRSKFPSLVDREHSEAMLLQHFCQRFSSKDLPTKATSLHAAVAGAPGTGKTRFVDQVCDWNRLSKAELRKKARMKAKLPKGFVESVQNWVQIRISYNGHTQATCKDHEYPLQCLVCRSGALEEDLETVLVSIANDHARRHGHNPKHVAIFLGLDELLRVDKDRGEPNSSHANAMAIAHEIGKIVESKNVPVYQLTTTLRDTLLKGVSKTLSGRDIFWVPLPRISSDGALKMLECYRNGTSQSPGISTRLPALLQKPFFEQLVYDCGGHPRTLECLLDAAYELTRKNIAKWTARQINAALSTGLKGKMDSADVPFALIEAILLGKAVRADTVVDEKRHLTYGDFVYSGVLANSIESVDEGSKATFTPRLPIVRLLRWADDLVGESDRAESREMEVARTLIQMLEGEEVWTWASFERFHAGWEHLMDVLRAGTSIRLSDHYKGAALGSRIKDAKFTYPPFSPHDTLPVVDTDGKPLAAEHCMEQSSRYHIVVVRNGLVMYIETRYSAPGTSTMATKGERNSKYSLWKRRLVSGDLLEKLGVPTNPEHIFVMALMRSANADTFKGLQGDAVLVSKGALLGLYGKSLSCRPQFMCLKEQMKSTPQLKPQEPSEAVPSAHLADEEPSTEDAEEVATRPRGKAPMKKRPRTWVPTEHFRKRQRFAGSSSHS
eukprot:m51a1_g4395 hypothetical protein (826) ;mRNA; f:370446-373533